MRCLVDPAKLTGYGLALRQVIDALSANKINVGGGYLEHGGEQELIRGVGLIRNETDIGNIVVSLHQGTPVYVSSVAELRRGAQIRQGAATRETGFWSVVIAAEKGHTPPIDPDAWRIIDGKLISTTARAFKRRGRRIRQVTSRRLTRTGPACTSDGLTQRSGYVRPKRDGTHQHNPEEK